MKECKLCDRPARMYCESDQANLCWECDAKVHCANFLAARHSRNLLCQKCQSPTPWKASGPKLGPTISVCEVCVLRCQGQQRQQEIEGNGENEDGNDADDDEIEGYNGASEINDDDEDGYDDDEDHDDFDDEEEEEEEEEEDGENQVVPWSSTPPPVPSSSSSEESSSRLIGASIQTTLPLKRPRQNADLISQDDPGCCSSQQRAATAAPADEEATSICSFRPLKDRKKEPMFRSEPISELRSESMSTLIDSLQRFQREKVSNEGDVLDICRLNKDPIRAVDFVSSASRSTSI